MRNHPNLQARTKLPDDKCNQNVGLEILAAGTINLAAPLSPLSQTIPLPIPNWQQKSTTPSSQQQQPQQQQERTTLKFYKPTAYLHSLKPLQTQRISSMDTTGSRKQSPRLSQPNHLRQSRHVSSTQQEDQDQDQQQ